jgi:DNA polymerase III sliding clamp (beta) subunit (PCNA family)
MVTVNRKALKDAVSLCSAALQRGPMVVESSLLLRYSCAELTVTGRSLGECEASARVKTDDNCDPDAAVVVDAKRLAAAIKSGAESVGLDLDPKQLLIRNVAETTLQTTMEVAEFPELLDVAPGDLMHVESRLLPAFGDEFKWVALAGCRDTTRRNICGVYSTGEGHLIATDGHRMHVAPLPEGTPSFFVPMAAIKPVLKLRGDISVHALQAGFALRGNNGGVFFGPYAHTFPPHAQVIPGRYGARCEVGLSESEAQRWLSTLAALGESNLRFSVNGKIAATGGEVEAPTSAEFPGERRWRQFEESEVIFGVNPAYLSDALTGLACEMILQDNTPTADPPQHLDPIRIDYASGRCAIVMPYRVK